MGYTVGNSGQFCSVTSRGAFSMSTEKTTQGAWRIPDIIDGRLVSRVYFYYTKREAIAEFREEFKG
jgi:hypothetical protein